MEFVAICYAAWKMNPTSQESQFAWELLIVLAKQKTSGMETSAAKQSGNWIVLSLRNKQTKICQQALSAPSSTRLCARWIRGWGVDNWHSHRCRKITLTHQLSCQVVQTKSQRRQLTCAQRLFAWYPSKIKKEHGRGRLNGRNRGENYLC